MITKKFLTLLVLCIRLTLVALSKYFKFAIFLETLILLVVIHHYLYSYAIARSAPDQETKKNRDARKTSKGTTTECESLYWSFQ